MRKLNPMSNRRQANPSRASSVMIALLLCASLAANIILAARFFHSEPSSPVPAGPSHPSALLATQPASLPADKLSSAPSVRTNIAPSFLWSQIESADYRQYVANLRAIGCPEQIVRDI